MRNAAMVGMGLVCMIALVSIGVYAFFIDEHTLSSPADLAGQSGKSQDTVQAMTQILNRGGGGGEEIPSSAPAPNAAEAPTVTTASVGGGSGSSPPPTKQTPIPTPTPVAPIPAPTLPAVQQPVQIVQPVVAPVVVPVVQPISQDPTITALYTAYKATYLRSDGSVISNPKPISWCPNGCIGCDTDVTSEAIARLARVAVLNNDHETFDKVNNYAKTTMRSPAGFLKWKLNGDGSAGSCGGENSAVDAELILIEALLRAEQKWGGYKNDARALMDAMKPGLINNTYVPMCMYPQGTSARACTNTVFLGYVNLPVLKMMCGVDSFWCNIHDKNKALLIRAVQGQGAYSTYYMDQNKWAWENADIHTQWVIKHLVSDGDYDAFVAVQPFYDQARTMFLANRAKGGAEICQEFHPSTGCKTANPPLRVYAGYLEMAKAHGDTEFANALTAFLIEKLKTSSTKPLAGEDNYANIVVLEGVLV